HQGHAHHRTADLGHGFLGGLFGRNAFFDHNALDVFDHDDGIIDQNPDGQHHGKHGEHIDRKTHSLHDGESPQNGNRHDQGGNERIAHVLEKDKHHDEHQHH